VSSSPTPPPAGPKAEARSSGSSPTVREQFLIEITGTPDEPGRHLVADLLERNRVFTAGAETV